MFSLFKKQIIDEPIEEQLNEFKEYIARFNANIKIQNDCDYLPNSFGELGLAQTNPIPVNGVVGEFKYLQRLRCACQKPLYFHRIGDKSIEWIIDPIDIYETVCYNGVHWDVLFFHMYHPRRSKQIPKGYTFCKFHEEFSRLAVVIGTNNFIENFPFGLTPDVKKFFIQLPELFIDKLLMDYENSVKADPEKFIRPQIQINKIKEASIRLAGRTIINATS